jgi:hypothetical protein|nr:hypothetical protein [Sinorhizobium meliloti]
MENDVDPLSSIPSADTWVCPKGSIRRTTALRFSLTRLCPDGVLREEIEDDLQIRRITNVEQRRSSFDHAFAAAFAVATEAPDLLPRQEA